MSDAPEVPLASLVAPSRSITYGIVQPGPDVSPDGIPLIRGKDYSSGKVDDSDLYHVSPAIDRPYARSKVQGGDILFSIVGYVGLVAEVPDSLAGANITQTTARISIDKRRADSGYLFHYLSAPHYRRQITRYEKGSAQPGLNLADVARLTVRLPSLPQQRRIAKILTTVDDAIEQTEALIAKTQQIKAGLVHDLLTRGVTAAGNLRAPRITAPKLYKKSPLSWIPKEWEVARLTSRRAANRAHLKTGPFGSALKLEHWVERGHPVITIGALGESKFIESELLYVSDATAERLREYQLAAGDVVFSRVADVGRSAVIHEPQQGWLMSSNLMRISLDLHQVCPTYLQAQLAYDPRVRRQIRATVNTGGRDVANSQILNRLDFAWPPYDEQQRIVERLASVEEQRQSDLELAGKLRAQKVGLMRDLLTGRIRVSLGDVRETTANV